jgi:predicted lipoprotein with Yx(FWY)xxD motif
MSGPTTAVRVFGVAATLLLASACGSSTPTPAASTAAPAASPTSAAASGDPLKVATTSLGPVLVDSKGMTVYLLTSDTPGHSNCNATCLKFWPPVLAPSGASVPSISGISAPLAVTKTTSGASMLTAGGWPLYTFLKDKAPGDVTGQGKKSFGGIWYVVSPSGVAVTKGSAG